MQSDQQFVKMILCNLQYFIAIFIGQNLVSIILMPSKVVSSAQRLFVSSVVSSIERLNIREI